MGDQTRVTMDETNEQYHTIEKPVPYLSSSVMKLAIDSMMMLQLHLFGLLPRVETSGMRRGTNWHEIREFSYQSFLNTTAVMPDELCRADGSPRTNANAREFMETHHDKQITSHKELEVLSNMEKAFWNNPAAARLEERVAHRENSYRVMNSGMLYGQKARIDALTSDGILLDYKTTTEQNVLASFGRVARRYKYGLSAVMYQDIVSRCGIDVSEMHFIVSSTVQPYECQVIKCDKGSLERWQAEYETLTYEINQNWERITRGDLLLPRGTGEIHEVEMF
ncbi:MAG: PD-(D/E)XK nuclease-like domain-containing protein [Pirellulales bacterium]|jgi:hypothetical protein|nr:PD-(D/E)XK nuclease-like domain-containing protein [Pirellulales bacterium]